MRVAVISTPVVLLLMLPLLPILDGAERKSPDVLAPPFWRRLPPPRAGEWLRLFPEPGETFSEYRAAAPSRPTKERRIVYIQPWLTRPAPDALWLDKLTKLMRAWFGAEVKTLPPGPMPERAWNGERRQYDAIRLAARLVRTLPADGLLMLGVTDRDLSLKSFRHALGWGALEHRVAVMSTYRLGRGDRFLRRALSLSLHEATHGLGLRHCVFYPCLMNGALALKETDARPMQLCPVCREKLCWNLSIEPLSRYGGLIDALGEVGLAEAAERTKRARQASRPVLD